MRTLVIGGAASGKSAFAEQLCLEHGGRRVYLATMEPGGAEAHARIERHRALRAGKGFETVERSVGLAALPNAQDATVLLECLGTLAANECFSPAGAGMAQALAAIDEGLRALEESCENLVVVTNDVFADGISYDPDTERYRAVLGQANAALAARFERVYEVTCGIAAAVKGGEAA